MYRCCSKNNSETATPMKKGGIPTSSSVSIGYRFGADGSGSLERGPQIIQRLKLWQS